MMSLVNIVRSLPLLFLLVNAGCNMGPKSAVVELSKSTQSKTNIDRNMHEVVVNEILPAGKYVYMKVREGNLEFWIATNTQSVQKDSTVRPY